MPIANKQTIKRVTSPDYSVAEFLNLINLVDQMALDYITTPWSAFSSVSKKGLRLATPNTVYVDDMFATASEGFLIHTDEINAAA